MTARAKIVLPGDWVDEAACQHVESSLFFPDTADYGPAIAVCKCCPVRPDCLAHALAQNEQEGVWGGHTPTERRNLRRKRQRDARASRLRQPRTALRPRFSVPVAQHGVRSGYTAGCRCDECTEANRMYERARKQPV